MKNWLSFIIPVYNGEKYITQAVESILNQAETGIEIVIIDDGSTDDSYLVCKELADKYNSIKLIHSENKGVSHARNLGVSKADAEWISFLDADDYLLESAVSEMKKFSTVKEDVVIFNYKRGSNKAEFNEEKKSITNSEAINILLDFAGYRMLLPTGMGEKYSVFTSCWAKMYRKSVIDTNEIQFQESLTLSEDMCYNLMYFKKIQNVLIVNKEVYNYSDNPESVTHSFSEKKFLGRKELIVYLDGVHDIPNECESAKQKYIVLTAIQLADKIAATKNKKLRKAYISFLEMEYVQKGILNKVDGCLSIGKKQNAYLNFQYWLLRHKLYGVMLPVGYIYAQTRG